MGCTEFSVGTAGNRNHVRELEDLATRVEWLLRGGPEFESRRLPLLYFAKDENPTFQIRSSWALFSRIERFQRLYFSI